MDWPAWGPTIVSALTCIFFAGVMYSKQSDHERRLKQHDSVIEGVVSDLKENAIDIAVLKAWRDGYNAARIVYDQHYKSNSQVQPQHAGGD